ncbi:MAG TPA: SCO family protein [Terriglobia bacterium]|jgi:protein SCO1/2
MKFIAAFFSLLLIASCSRTPDLQTFYPVPDFSLTDQTDRTVTMQELKGRAWVADFIFTNCGGTCPVMTEEMRKLQATLPPNIRLVSFTVDPNRDTTKVLAAYAAEHGATRDRWLFLTGDKQALYDICIKGFKLALEDDAGTPLEPITHSTRFVLVDDQGQIRGYYSGTEDKEMSRLAADAKKLS